MEVRESLAGKQPNTMFTARFKGDESSIAYHCDTQESAIRAYASVISCQSIYIGKDSYNTPLLHYQGAPSSPQPSNP